MLITKTSLRFLAGFLCLILSSALPAVAQEASANQQNNILLAQAICASCGAQLDRVLLLESNGEKKKIGNSVLTDSLWGNLILELAYVRDPDLHKLAKRGKLVNNAMTAAVMGIAAGTLAQGITALCVINPPPGKPDSYAPLNVGVALSGATMLVMGGRLYMGYKLATAIQEKQIYLRDQVQSILAHMESSQGNCEVARGQLNVKKHMTLMSIKILFCPIVSGAI